MAPAHRGRRRAARGVIAALRTVYLGTSGFAARVLRHLAGSPHRPSLVVTPPDRPRGRGRKVASPPAAEAARELGIELLQPASVNEPGAVAAIQAHDPQVPVVCAFGQLIGAELLAGPPILNVHPSLLPRWRGAAPIERAMIAGDAETGVSIMRIGEGLDDGPIALRDSVAIGPSEDFGSLEARLAELAGELLVRALDLAERGELQWEEQDDSAATYAEKIGPGDRRLDPRQSAADLERRVRALTPHVGAYLELDNGERLGVRAASTRPSGTEPGALRAEDDSLILSCGEGGLDLLRVQPPGGREMDAAQFLRGHSCPQLAPIGDDG